MKRAFTGFLVAALCCPISAFGDSVIAARTVRAFEIIAPSDVITSPEDAPGALMNAVDVVGMEARVVLYAGHPVLAEHVGPPAVIERNQIVKLVYQNGSLSIETDGRSLERAAIGEPVRVMNLASRTTVSGWVTKDGRVRAGQMADASQGRLK